MGELLTARRISQLRKSFEQTPNPPPEIVRELMQALLEAGDRRGAIEVFRRFQRSGNPVTPELAAEYTAALWSQPRELPTNLPQPRRTFVGRDTELSAVIEGIRTNRGVQILGAGGIGKSRLALEFARRSIGDFAEGVWWIDLSSVYDDEGLLARVVRAMRLEDRPYDLDGLLARIGATNALLVMDCCELAAPEAAAFLSSAIERCPRLAIVATSRVQLHASGAAAISLQPLKRDAVRLFLERAVDADPDFVMTEENERIAGEICRSVGALPLGIELACAYLAHVDIEELRDRLRRKRLADVSDALAETIRWTYELLEPADRAMLRALSLLDFPFTLDDALAIAAVADGRACLDRLISASIVVSERSEGISWYRLLDTTREFGRAEMEKHGETPLLRRRFVERMREAALEFESRIAAKDEMAARQLAGAHGNLMRAIEIACESPTLTEHGLAITGAAAMQLGVVGLASQTIGHVERIITAARRFARDRSAFFDAALEAFAWLANRVSAAPKAMAINEERINRARARHDICAIARALASSVIAAVNAGAYDRAREIATEAVDASRRCGDVSIRARALRSLASFYLNMDEPQSALPLYEEFFSLEESQIPPMQVAMALHDYGLALKNTGDRARARALLLQCVERALAMADYGTATHGYHTLGQLDLEERDCASALRNLRDAVELSTRGINLRTQLDAFEDTVFAAVRDDQLERLAFVLGFVDAGRSRAGFHASPEIAPRIAAIRSAVHSRMDEAAFNAATMRGRLAETDQVLAVLRELQPGEPQTMA
jgi:non-specific serine/threonine protein kinase